MTDAKKPSMNSYDQDGELIRPRRSSPSLACSAPYRVKQRESDGVWCIWAPAFNVVIAEFVPGTAVDARIIKAALESGSMAQSSHLTQQPTRDNSAGE